MANYQNKPVHHFYSHAPRGARPDVRLACSAAVNFYSHAPRGARRGNLRDFIFCSLFLLTRPSRGATDGLNCTATYTGISTHTPLAGRDVEVEGVALGLVDFYSHAPRGARHSKNVLYPAGRNISTHTPLAGRDLYSSLINSATQNFYSHAPRGARLLLVVLNRLNMLYFYSHAPRGARPGYWSVKTDSTNFYSHAPRGARHCGSKNRYRNREFLLTRPSRGATAVTCGTSYSVVYF